MKASDRRASRLWCSKEALSSKTSKSQDYFSVDLDINCLTESRSSCFASEDSLTVNALQVSYMILARVSPVTHSIGNCLKRVIVIVASVIFFKNPVSQQNIVGKHTSPDLDSMVSSNRSTWFSSSVILWRPTWEDQNAHSITHLIKGS